jgi:hypothetical protein
VDKLEYIAMFPDNGSLETFSKISKIMMSLHRIKIKISKSVIDPEAIEVLQSTRVKIYGLPGIACKKEVVMKATLAGEPLVVEELSLIKTDPVRVKLNCREPSKLRGFVKILFNNVGYNARFVSEKYKDKAADPPSPPDKKDEDYEDEEEEEDDESEDFRDMKHMRKSSSKQSSQEYGNREGKGVPSGSKSCGSKIPDQGRAIAL